MCESRGVVRTRVGELPRVDRLHTRSLLFEPRLLLHLRQVREDVLKLVEVGAGNCLESQSSHDKEVVLLPKICLAVGLEVPCSRVEDLGVVERT